MKIRIEQIGRITHAYRLAAGRWLPLAIDEARRLLALGLAQEVSCEAA